MSRFHQPWVNIPSRTPNTGRPGSRSSDRSKRSDAAFEIVDIKDFNLPLLDEPVPPAMGQYTQPHTKHWAARIAQFRSEQAKRRGLRDRGHKRFQFAAAR